MITNIFSITNFISTKLFSKLREKLNNSYYEKINVRSRFLCINDILRLSR